MSTARPAFSSLAPSRSTQSEARVSEAWPGSADAERRPQSSSEAGSEGRRSGRPVSARLPLEPSAHARPWDAVFTCYAMHEICSPSRAASNP